ncbi:MAG: polyamine aminopropyltransferase [Calditrichaeota bacterium]|nr:polyamine aminopropyltransferase [Calditrichota bacterium]
MTGREESRQLRGNQLLKAAIFATGLSGIVAEYVMSTMASYLLGNAVLQWTLTVSFMLFAMGVGSRLSKYVNGNLLDNFILTELGLSMLSGVCAVVVYFSAAFIQPAWLIIYPLSFAIGVLIGLEIPLAARLNDYFEDLRLNISAVMEKDYFGALLGGLIFAFFALPYLGLTYTPILLGSVNLLVALALYWRQRADLVRKRLIAAGFILVPMMLGLTAIFAEPIILFGEQQKYLDRVIYEEQTPYQRIVLTQWKDNVWLYLNGNEQFSSFDEERYHEPLVHPAMAVSVARQKVLILGGGDGLAARELLKYPDVKEVVLVDLDPAMTRLAATHPEFLRLNLGSLSDPRVRVINRDAYSFLEESNEIFDVILIDLPDPKTVGLSRLYSQEFYHLVSRQLTPGGVMVTQASSPFFSKEAFLCILNTVQAGGFTVVPFQNHIPTLGQWGFVMGMKGDITPEALRNRLLGVEFAGIETRFLNREAMQAMLFFGKGDLAGREKIAVNRQIDLVLFEYYNKGSWDIY